MALQEETNQEIPTTPVENRTPITQEPTYEGRTLRELQRYVPSLKTLPSETIQNSAKEEESEFWYGFDKSESLTNNAMLYLEAVNPVFANAFSNETPDEIYGKGFTNLSVDDRRKVLLDYRKDQLKREYPILSQVPDDDLSWEASVGNLLGTIWDPTTLTPVGTGLRTLGLVSTALGLGYSVSDQLANKGTVDAKEAAVMGVVSGVGGVVVGKGMQVIGNKFKLARSRKNTAEDMKQADLKVDEINYVLTKASANGMDIDQANKLVLSELNLTQDDLIKILAKTDKKPVFPAQTSAQVTLSVLSKGTGEADRVTNGLAERLFGNLSTKLGYTSPQMKLRLRKFEKDTHATRAYAIEEVASVRKAMGKIPKSSQPAFTVAINNGEFGVARKMLVDNAGDSSLAAFDRGIKEIKRLGKMNDIDIDGIPNYFPRSVKDFDGLQEAMGRDKTLSGVYDKALERYAKIKDISVLELSQKQREAVINKITRGFDSTGIKNKKLTWSKERKVPKLTEDMAQYYDDPSTALWKYVNSSADDIHKRELFKGSLVKTEDGTDIDLTKSIGALVEQDLPNLNKSQQKLIRDLLQTRFGMGEVAPHVAQRVLRDVGYATTLANPISALTQIKDLGISAYVNGLFPTIKSIFGKSDVTMKEMGLDSVMAAELTSLKDTSHLLHSVLGWSQFRRIDRFGKDVFLNASLKNGKSLAQTAKGEARLARKYKEAFGEGEFNKLLNDLKSNPPKITENVKLYLWSELSDVQPISLSEMPQAYLNNPDGRIFYALKSFGVKQLDLIRRTIIDEYKSGDKIQAGKNLVAYTALLATMGATVDETKDAILGRGFNTEDISDNAIENLYGIVGMSKYALKQASTRGLGEVIVDFVTPPIPFLNSIAKDIAGISTGKQDVPWAVVKELPIGGKLLYQYVGGGIEKDLKREAQERKKERVFK
jgi:hypothetical protein